MRQIYIQPVLACFQPIDNYKYSFSQALVTPYGFTSTRQSLFLSAAPSHAQFIQSVRNLNSPLVQLITITEPAKNRTYIPDSYNTLPKKLTKTHGSLPTPFNASPPSMYLPMPKSNPIRQTPGMPTQSQNFNLESTSPNRIWLTANLGACLATVKVRGPQNSPFPRVVDLALEVVFLKTQTQVLDTNATHKQETLYDYHHQHPSTRTPANQPTTAL